MPEAAPVSPASLFAESLLAALVRLGVRHVVLSPGSRSQALALAAAGLEAQGAVRLHVRIDERSAGFTALGTAVETRMPAAVITTSGTATANLHPAVLEAHHSGVPLIVITADRPAELRGVRANQTTVQPGMYGDAVRLMRDVPAPEGATGEADAAADLAAEAVHAAHGMSSGTPGPVHLNLAFREPLSGLSHPERPESPERPERPESPENPENPERVEEPRSGVSKPTPAPMPGPPTYPGRSHLELEHGPRTVVIAGHDSGPDAEQLAHDGGWPLLAEVSSGSRYGRNLVAAYRELLADGRLGGRVERAIVFGHPTLSREIPGLLSRSEVDVIVVAPTGAEVYNPARRDVRVAASVTVANGSRPPVDARAWLGAWVVESRGILDSGQTGPESAPPDVDASRSYLPAERIAFAKAEYAAIHAPVTRRMLVESVWRFTWPNDRLVLGASRLIRDADRTVAGKKIRVHANRGLAGIDGTVSTAVGIALATQGTDAVRPGVTRALLGDLTLLHDVGGLLIGEGELRPNVQLIVGNDGGGTIFDALEVAHSAPPAAFERVMFTPQSVSIESLAGAYGWSYARATTHGELDQVLSAPAAGPSIVEVPLAR
ncbi:2-succinyl-5-enolpyruvyl-6-hydroxy-3-cyclohexene-1-carboxylic-acid synthase [Microbacterium sp. STN6]|uniref:2-succinyl-5-enolpyruvyl-6-hydroxy-3- cyclohexene-1-carboxylic-acid synthase n=1 Tax=Microbacterium sp. STN6 TaxID=2995588 RepID=UPI002260B437|nr:2-succinyl-5-enolpyruvyl-6-hydroxy-3-cyclohexene-1-carboxylic-acid synthase [Microbacterium sp. STN6]MCX7520690.1 2-succinyl-5-enolpyruvyl-6-hydroxy-3-cyclohexene-1-carboxylic-acid synthase [Microbacterium sp. STN6]